jgi:transcription termination factor NusB
MMRGEVAHGIQIIRLARENVILRNRLEIFRGERQVHRVARFARKINREPREHRVHRLDAPEAPTAMRAAAAFGQLRQRFDVAAFNFSGGGEFFKFGFHNKIVILSSRIHHDSIKRGERTKTKTNCGANFGPRAKPAARSSKTCSKIALANARLSSADRGLCQEIVYGVVRWQAALDWLIARKTGGREQKPALQNLLRLGLYQIFWLDRIPDHAAVHETVELAKQNGFGPQAGFVNAILRGYLREADETKKFWPN